MTRIGAGVLLLLLVAALLLVLHYVPFDLASFAAWTGIGLAVAGLACVVKPPRWLGVRSRLQALAICGLAVALAIAAIAWPSSVIRREASRRTRLDDFLPEYQFSEYHETVVHAPVERVVEAARVVSFADMPAAAWLMRVRAAASGRIDVGSPDRQPILGLMSRPGTGFLPLDVSNPREIVYGMAGRPWTNGRPPAIRTPEEFLAFAAPGQIRVAFDIRIVDEGQGRVRISTETRALGNDAEARRLFARYWRVIYPGSAIIRRVWIDAIAARASAG